MMKQSRRGAALLLAFAGLLAARSSSAQSAVADVPSAAASAPPAPPSARVLSLEQALRIALERHPSLGQSRAARRAAGARVNQAFAGFLPEVTGTASYTLRAGRVTTPVVTVTGAGTTVTGTTNSTSTSNAFNFGLTARQLIYDFGQASGRYNVATSNAEVQQQNEAATRQNVTLAVKNDYLLAHAQKALMDVSRETLANQERHLAQVEGFVEVGTRPRIDLVQAQADVENARLSLVNTENAYGVARAELAQAMGLETQADFDVSDQRLPPVPEEDGATAELFRLAIAARPELRAQAALTRSQEQTIRSIQGAYGPSINVSTGVNETGSELDNLAWSWNAQALLNWPIFQGGLTRAQVAEARANLDSTTFQTASLRQQVFVEVEQARLNVRGAKQALATADKLVANSRERLGLAEGRYQVGVGSIIELADAQLALTTALAQQVQADYSLSAARAALTKALGRE
jgi:outer membrane protein